jgi:hypothetical protein
VISIVRITTALSVGVTALLAVDSHGALVQYTNKAAWQAAAGTSTYIGFTEHPVSTIITDQYASLGVTFTDGDDAIFTSDPGLLPIDGRGLRGHWGQFGFYKPITVQFDAPRYAVAADFVGGSIIKLYMGNQLVGQSGDFVPAWTGPFGGVTSTVAFDRVVLDNGATIGIDSLYFGAAVPGPGGALLLLAAGGASARSRRRRSAIMQQGGGS